MPNNNKFLTNMVYRQGMITYLPERIDYAKAIETFGSGTITNDRGRIGLHVQKTVTRKRRTAPDRNVDHSRQRY